MGYYPLPESEAVRLRALLEFTGPASIVDPCVGQGMALEIITKGADVHRYGIELDAERAALALSKPTLRLRDWPGGEQPHGTAVSRSHLSLARNGWRVGNGHSL